MFTDRTVSRVGQQYYYAVFRTIPVGEKRNNRLDYLIRLFKENPSLKESVLEQLARLKNPEAYYITSLIHDPYVQKPVWFWVVRLLSAISTVSILLSFLFPQLLIFLLFVLSTNYFIHYWNKRNLFQHSGSILQLLLLHRVAKQLLKIPEFANEAKELRESVKSLDRIGHQMAFFKLEAKFQSELGLVLESIAEILKALLLIEPQLLFKALAALDSKKRANSSDLSVCSRVGCRYFGGFSTRWVSLLHTAHHCLGKKTTIGGRDVSSASRELGTKFY